MPIDDPLKEAGLAVVDKGQFPGSQSVLRLGIGLAEFPFRMAPGWAALAGALASGGLRWQRESILLLLLTIVLTDGLWGQLWTLLQGKATPAGQDLAVPAQMAVPLPYAAYSSPLSSLWRWLVHDARSSGVIQPTAVWRSLILTLLLTVVAAWLLSPVALVLSAVTLLLAVLARGGCPLGILRALAQALSEIGLPWLLAHLLFGGDLRPGLPLLFSACYVLLGAGLLARAARGWLWLVNVAQLVPLVGLMAAGYARMSGALAITLLAPLAWQPWLRLRGSRAIDGMEYRRRGAAWWWAGMMISALAVGM